MNYTLHFEYSGYEVGVLNCAKLAAKINTDYKTPSTVPVMAITAAVPVAVPAVVPVAVPAVVPVAVPAVAVPAVVRAVAATRASDWKAVGYLNWPFMCDLVLDRAEVSRRIESLRGRDVLNCVLEAMNRIVMTLRTGCNCGAFDGITVSDLVQIIACGENVVKTIIDTPEFLVYVISQLQKIDLADLLGLVV